MFSYDDFLKMDSKLMEEGSHRVLISALFSNTVKHKYMLCYSKIRAIVSKALSESQAYVVLLFEDTSASGFIVDIKTGAIEPDTDTHRTYYESMIENDLLIDVAYSLKLAGNNTGNKFSRTIAVLNESKNRCIGSSIDDCIMVVREQEGSNEMTFLDVGIIKDISSMFYTQEDYLRMIYDVMQCMGDMFSDKPKNSVLTDKYKTEMVSYISKTDGGSDVK
ncbi:MAG: hypothetical protein ACRC92_20200 [Peptostreptococcaceae bacterium]